ncbi:MAG TPA: metallophosphoesterase [Lentisphaeria bacterium]|nr:metallophosphoesterase [Lentisphaeria bacterium]
MRIAVLTDSHYSSTEATTCGTRQTGIADILMRRAAFRLNRLLRPDVTILLGDMVNAGHLANSQDELSTLWQHVKLISSPVIAIPGNHDGAIDDFYQVAPRPEPIVDIAGVRFVVNLDRERPGYNAFREERDLARLAEARQGWHGPIVTLQHIPAFPPGLHTCPYNYVNALAVTAAEAEAGVTLSLSGHYHPGFGPLNADGVTYLAAPALCEGTFPITLIDLDEKGDLTISRENLKMPETAGLVDTHVHTRYAYCNENMEPNRIAAFAHAFGLAEFRLSEHSGHLLHTCPDYYRAQDATIPAPPANRRLDAYLAEMAAAGIPAAWTGLEIDCRHDGTPLLAPADWERIPFRIGALHQMPSIHRRLDVSQETLRNEFLGLMERFLRYGFFSLAHPFRVFRRAKLPIPPGCFSPLVRMLKETDTAAEINFHTNEPPVEFFQECLNAGVKVTLGSDAHNLYEVGDFALHLDFLKRCGFNGDWRDIIKA